MTKGTLLKFLFLTISNKKSFLMVNFVFLIPTILFFYTVMQLVPWVVRYVDSLNISVENINPRYQKLAIVVASNSLLKDGQMNDLVYVFQKESFNSIRKHVFMRYYNNDSEKILTEKALGYSEILFYNEPLNIKGRTGEHIVTLQIESVKDGTVEILFFNKRAPIGKKMLIFYLTLMLISFVIISGSLGGINDFTQRIVFHEIKDFAYLFNAIKRHFMRSLSVTLFFTIVIGAIAANIYFYIFLINSNISVFIAAINFWMFIFFLFILFWVYPLLVLNREESIWKVMKKSLFVSFDNFSFTFDALVVLFLMFIISCITIFIVPGFAGAFTFINTVLKEISSRYSKLDAA